MISFNPNLSHNATFEQSMQHVRRDSVVIRLMTSVGLRITEIIIPLNFMYFRQTHTKVIPWPLVCVRHYI